MDFSVDEQEDSDLIKGLPNRVKNSILKFWCSGGIKRWKKENSLLSIPALLADERAVHSLLADNGNSSFIVVESFMEDINVTQNAKHEAEELLKSGKLTAGGVGESERRRMDTAARSDQRVWLHQLDLKEFPSLAAILESIRAFAKRLNDNEEDVKLSGESAEVQLAYFSKNRSHYVRHKDANSGSPRYLTVTIYLNSEWDESDGGQLRISTPTEFVDIYPVLNRSVIFQSKRIIHEVVECRKGRWAVTAWLPRIP